VPNPNGPFSREGTVLTKATLRAADKLDVSQKVLAPIIGVSESVVWRMRNGSFALERISGKAFELATLFIRLYRSLDAIAGADEAVAKAGLNNEYSALRSKPIDVIQKIQGYWMLCNIWRLDGSNVAPVQLTRLFSSTKSLIEPRLGSEFLKK
jgi:hypothetical protein